MTELYNLDKLMDEANNDKIVYVARSPEYADAYIDIPGTISVSPVGAWDRELGVFFKDRPDVRVVIYDDKERAAAEKIVSDIAAHGGGADIIDLGDDDDSYDPDKSPTTSVMVADDMPSTLAAEFEYRSPVTHHYNSIDGWSIYSKNIYQQVVDDNEIRLHIRKFLPRCIVEKRRRDKETKKLIKYTERLKKQSRGYVSDIMEALAAMKSVHILPSQKAVCCFNGQLNPDTTIALKNGLLDLSNPKKPVLRDFTSQFYTFNYLPVSYNPDAKCDTWLDMLGYYFADEDGKSDELAIDVIHSWMKRWLLRITEPHKICTLIGEPRSGKSTIGRIATSLIGINNVSSITISSLAGNHGLYGLMNKQLGVMWDASISGRHGDISKAVEVLKNISGQDNISVNPKNRDIIDLPSLKLNILMIANTPADLRDNTGALASRFTFLKTTQSFLGSEDPTLEKRVIEHELSGILNKILAAPNRILEHPSSEGLGQEFAEMSSPYSAFANECCDTGDPELFIPTNILWAYYSDWCEKYNHRPPSAQKFKVEFISGIRGVKRCRPRLTDDEVEKLEIEHVLDQRPGPTLSIQNRPYAYKGIDLKIHLKGGWYNPKTVHGGSDFGLGSGIF
jgi:putative DNA primase/helicase